MRSATPRARDGLSVSLMQDFAEKALVPKLDSYISVHISADSCTLDLLYVISKLPCKIDQRELEMGIYGNIWTYYDIIICIQNETGLSQH